MKMSAEMLDLFTVTSISDDDSVSGRISNLLRPCDEKTCLWG